MSPKIPVRILPPIRELAPQYLESRKRDIGSLKDALTRKDFGFITQLSHKTKGTAGAYGFTELGQIARSLENASKSQNFSEATLAIAAMEDYLARVEIVD